MCYKSDYIAFFYQKQWNIANVTDRVFSTWIYGPSAKQEGHELKRKKQRAAIYSTEQENEVSWCSLNPLEIEFSWEVNINCALCLWYYQRTRAVSYTSENGSSSR